MAAPSSDRDRRWKRPRVASFRAARLRRPAFLRRGPTLRLTCAAHRALAFSALQSRLRLARCSEFLCPRKGLGSRRPPYFLVGKSLERAHAQALGRRRCRNLGPAHAATEAPCISARAGRNLTFTDYFPRHNRRHGSAFERAAVKRRVAGLAWGFFHFVGPGVIGRENCQIGWLAGSDLAIHSKDPRRSGRKKLDHSHQRNSTAMHELLECEAQGGFES